MLSNKFSVSLVVSAAWMFASACAVSDVSKREESATRGAPEAPSEEPPSEEPGEGPGEEPCSASTGPALEGWRTYENGHFSFQAPTTYRAVDGDDDVPVELLSEIRNNTDPTVSAAFAETHVGHEPSAFWFGITVREVHKSGTPADGTAWLSTTFPPGLPPPTREYNVCGLMSSKVTTYSCDPAAEGIVKCWTLRGYTYGVFRFVYHGGRSFEMRCSGSGITADTEEICAKALASLVIRD
jgi:hypothetical protein